MNMQPISQWRWNEHWSRSTAEAISELEREAQVRFRCYDRWITEGKVSRVDAWDRLERLLSGIRMLRTLLDAETKRDEQAAQPTATELPAADVVPMPDRGDYSEIPGEPGNHITYRKIGA